MKWSLLAWAIAVIILIGLWLLNAPEDLAKHSQSQARLDQGDYSVGTMDLSITDLSRVTPALGGYEGDDKRTLIGTVWFPEGESTGHPLIVFSHGFGSHHKGCRHIAEYLARNGYVVAAIDFPLSNAFSLAQTPQLLDIINQPGDVSAVIDQLLTLNKDSNSTMHKRIDSNNIGAMGLSLGGLTTALVSFHPDLKDERIKAVTMLAPPLEGFSENFYASNPNVKSLLISGTLDRVVPEVENAVAVIPRHPSGWFISLDKGSHLGFANLGNPIRWMENPDNPGCRFMNMMMAKLDLPDRWDAVLPNTDAVLRDVVTAPPCPEISGRTMNALKQQWLSRIAIGSFFDMHLRSGEPSLSANEFFTTTLSVENPEVRLTLPR